jgi:hypothetical protein
MHSKNMQSHRNFCENDNIPVHGKNSGIFCMLQIHPTGNAVLDFLFHRMVG